MAWKPAIYKRNTCETFVKKGSKKQGPTSSKWNSEQLTVKQQHNIIYMNINIFIKRRPNDEVVKETGEIVVLCLF